MKKTLTFLYRAPKIELRPLNIGMIAEKYKSIFELTDEEATEMAKETRGYPFAFQVLGIFVLSIIPYGIMYYLNSVSIWRNMYMKRYGVSCQKVIRNCWLLWQKPMTPKWKQYERL